MFVEGKIENWIIFIDTNNIGVLELDFKVSQFYVNKEQNNQMLWELGILDILIQYFFFLNKIGNRKDCRMYGSKLYMHLT